MGWALTAASLGEGVTGLVGLIGVGGVLLWPAVVIHLVFVGLLVLQRSNDGSAKRRSR